MLHEKKEEQLSLVFFLLAYDSIFVCDIFLPTEYEKINKKQQINRNRNKQ